MSKKPKKWGERYDYEWMYETLGALENKFQEVFEGEDINPSVYGSVNLFRKRGLEAVDLMDAMQIALEKCLDSERTIKYFYGVCWVKVDTKRLPKLSQTWRAERSGT